jgi:hypothetical protein
MVTTTTPTTDTNQIISTNDLNKTDDISNISKDFYKALYESLDNEDDMNPDNDSTNSEVCLITNEPLQTNFVTLECNHRFNYIPLFNDVKNHKKKFNTMERRTLKVKEVRCPYCRNIQKTLLPYYENMGVKMVHGVNYYDETKTNMNINTTQNIHSLWKVGVCAYKMETIGTDDDDNNNIVIKPCSKKTVKLLMETGKTYCSCHYSSAFNEYAKKKKEKEIQKKKEEKLALKQKAKEEKDAAKLALKNAIPLCVQILKTGKNKGQPCGCKAIQKQDFCSRHAPKNNGDNKNDKNDNIILA